MLMPIFYENEGLEEDEAEEEEEEQAEEDKKKEDKVSKGKKRTTEDKKGRESRDDVSSTSSRQDSVPLLFGAINAGNLQGVKDLLDQTSEFLNSSRYGGLTPLHAACHMEQLDILKLLISKGSKVNSLDSLGNTVLHVAVSVKWYDGITELLKHGASPNRMSQPPSAVNGILNETPLHSAVRIGDKESTALLLNHQPDLHIRDSRNYSIFHLAAASRNLSVLKQLLAEKDSSKQVREIAKDGFSLFHAALSNDIPVENEFQMLKIVQAIHKFCDNVNQVNLLGESPLILACGLGLPTVVKFLLANGADPTQVTRERQSTLHATCSSGCPVTLRHLLSTGRVSHLICCRDNNGFHPFYFAVTSGSIDCCKILLENGEHLTQICKDGMSNCSLIIEKLPSAMQLFRDIFDNGVKLSKKPQHDPDFSITFDYSTLMSPEKSKMQSSIVSELADTALESLIKHPLVESFLYIKWCRIRRIFYFNVVEFFVFLLLHTSFVMLTFGNDSVDWEQNASGLRVFKFFHILLLLLLFIPGVIVVSANYKKYLLQWETYTRLLSLMCAAIVIFMTSATGPKDVEPPLTTQNSTLNITANESIAAVDNTTFTIPTEVENGRPELSVDRAFASMSVFFGWVQLMMLLGRFPALGAYILMFTKVAKSVIKFILSFLSLLIGFSLSFHILFLQLNVFADFELSFAKTLMMMTGEIAFSEFVGKEDMPFPTYSLIVLSVFLFMVTVIMSNLLIGLAVNDIPDLKRQGKIKRLVKQASYLMAYEKLITYAYNMRCFPGKLRRMLSKRCNIKSVITILPNKEQKRHKYMQTIPDETLREAITLGSCENPEDFPTIVEEDITHQLKAFHIRYSSDRRTQRHKFSDLADMCNNIQKQMDMLQHKMNNQLSHVSMQLQQQLQQNQNLYNLLSQEQSPKFSKKIDDK